MKQSATLAGLITSPSRFDPIDHPEDSKVRRDYALDQMVHYGYLDQAKADELKAEKVTTDERAEVINAPANSEYFVDYTKRYLIDKYGGPAVFGGGFRVTTSLDLGLQRAAEAAVNAHLPSPSDPEGALVSIDPQTGEILAMVGGRGFKSSQVNLAVSGLRLRSETFGGTGRQAGSSFKAFTLAAAMHAGLRPQRHVVRAGHDHDPEHRVLHERRAVAALERVGLRGGLLLAEVGDRELRQHGVRAGRRAARSGEGRRHGAPAGHPRATWIRCARSRSASRP